MGEAKRKREAAARGDTVATAARPPNGDELTPEVQAKVDGALIDALALHLPGMTREQIAAAVAIVEAATTPQAMMRIAKRIHRGETFTEHGVTITASAMARFRDMLASLHAAQATLAAELGAVTGGT